MKIGEKIRNAREDMDLTQSEVASLIPMNQSSYSKIERDVQEPNIGQLRQICRILHLSADYLLSIGSYREEDNPDIGFAREVAGLYRKYYGRK